MMDIEQYLIGTLVLGAVWGGSALLALRGFNKLFGILRARHTDLWLQLGEPASTSRTKPEASKRLRAMVAAGASYETEDSELKAHLTVMSKVTLAGRVASTTWVIWTLALLVDVGR